MNPSLFATDAEKLFVSLPKIVEKKNGERKDFTYLSRGENSILRKEYSDTGMYEIANVSTKYVAADFVAADSPLPLKSRGTLAVSTGRLPKIGLKMTLKESELTTLLRMQASGSKYTETLRKLSNDALICNTSIDEQIERALLFGLSNGYVALSDDSAPGMLLRINYGYRPENTFAATTPGAISLEDIRRMVEKATADGNTITRVYMGRKAFNELRGTREGRELVANAHGQLVTDESVLPTPGRTAFTEAFRDEFGAELEVIDRSVLVEKDGVAVKEQPWNQSRVVGVCSDQVGALVYATPAEKEYKVQGVLYSEVEDYKLISKYSTSDPLTEITAGQAIAAPIIENSDQIYIYDFSTGQVVDETAEAKDTTDAKVTVWGKTYTKANFITALKGYANIKSNASDEAVIKAVNSLTAGDAAALEAEVEQYKV